MANEIKFIVLGDVKDLEKNIGKAADSLEEFSKSAKKLGQEIGQVGSIVSLLGASISGPLVLAFNNAAKSSAGAANEVKRFHDITEKFQKVIADALVPVFEKLNNVLSGLYNAFNSMDVALRNQLIQGALIAGIFLTLSGVLTIIIAKILSLSANIALLASKFLIFATVHPVILAVGAALGVIIVLMFKFKSVADVVLSTFQVLFLLLQNGFLTVKAALEEFTSVSLRNISNILSALAKIPGPQQEALQGLADNILNTSVLANRLAFNDMQAIVDKANEIGTIMTTGQGTWAVVFDELKTKATDFISSLTDKGTLDAALITWKDFIDKLKLWWSSGGAYYKQVQENMVGSLRDSLQKAAQLNSKFATAYKVVSIGEAIMNTAAGVTRAFKDYSWPMSMLVAAIVGAAGAVQIATIAAQSFAVGSPNIPKDMMANVHRGETIIPETFADAIRAGDLTLSGPRGGNQAQGGLVMDFTGATFNGITESFVRDIFTRASEAINNRTLSPLPAV